MYGPLKIDIKTWKGGEFNNSQLYDTPYMEEFIERVADIDDRLELAHIIYELGIERNINIT